MGEDVRVPLENEGCPLIEILLYKHSENGTMSKSFAKGVDLAMPKKARVRKTLAWAEG